MTSGVYWVQAAGYSRLGSGGWVQAAGCRRLGTGGSIQAAGFMRLGSGGWYRRLVQAAWYRQLGTGGCAQAAGYMLLPNIVQCMDLDYRIEDNSFTAHMQYQFYKPRGLYESLLCQRWCFTHQNYRSKKKIVGLRLLQSLAHKQLTITLKNFKKSYWKTLLVKNCLIKLMQLKRFANTKKIIRQWFSMRPNFVH